ncbi:MAG: hypothetical protein WD070_04420 [Pirellulaceae bacterium]
MPQCRLGWARIQSSWPRSTKTFLYEIGDVHVEDTLVPDSKGQFPLNWPHE